MLNYFDLKRLKAKIENQKLKVAKIKEKSTGITQTLSGMPGSGGIQDSVLDTVSELDCAERMLEQLIEQLKNAIDSIPDEYIRVMIDTKINHNFSWNKIAMIKGGNNTGDGVRKMCTRYKW